MSELLSRLRGFKDKIQKKIVDTAAASGLLVGHNKLLDGLIFGGFEHLTELGKSLSPEVVKALAYQKLMERLLETMPSYDSAQPLLGSEEDQEIFFTYKTRRFLEAALPGDVILVRGNQRISRIIQTLTTSPYSHSAYYLGQGELIEAEPEGVVISPISKYINLDLRICRPSLLDKEGLAKVNAFMERMLVEQPKYDVVNIEKLLFKYAYSKFRPDTKVYIGGSTDFERLYICSGMIARAFQEAGYPIAPSLRFRHQKERRKKARLETGEDYFKLALHRTKNYSQIVPCDFDNSPFFATVKFMYLDTQIKAQRHRSFDMEG